EDHRVEPLGRRTDPGVLRLPRTADADRLVGGHLPMGQAGRDGQDHTGPGPAGRQAAIVVPADHGVLRQRSGSGVLLQDLPADPPDRHRRDDRGLPALKRIYSDVIEDLTPPDKAEPPNAQGGGPFSPLSNPLGNQDKAPWETMDSDGDGIPDFADPQP